MIPVWAVSLKSRTDRRDLLSATFAKLGIPFQFFDAIDGRQMTAHEVAAMSPRRFLAQARELNLTEIGCAASFRALMGQIASGSDEFVAIFEDDANPDPKTVHFLDAEILRKLPRFDVFHLDYRSSRKRALLVAREYNENIYAPLKSGFGCAGQIVTKEGARKIFKGLVPLYAPLDDQIFREARIPNLAILQITPGTVRTNGLPTNMLDKNFEPWSIKNSFWRKVSRLRRTVRSVARFGRTWGWINLFRLQRR